MSGKNTINLKNNSGSELVDIHISCPVCPSSDAYCTYKDGHGHCFSCGYHTGGKDTSEQQFTYEYLPLRGVTKETLKFYDIKTKIDHSGKPISLGFKYPDGEFKVRLLDKKEFYWEPKVGSGLFGRDKFAAGSHKYVIITEGELDAASIHQVTRVPSVSVQSSSSAVRDCTVDYDWLQCFERIYLAFDNDERGRTAARSVAKLFDNSKVYLVKFSNRKDANEYLQADESNELLNLWSNARKYLPESLVSSLLEFKTILSAPKKLGVSYPFPTLTKMTYGIRTGESVLITAQEKVGKTELMHAIEHHLLKETQDAIGAIFLEEDKQRHLQAIAGLELQKPVHLPDCECTQDEVFLALEKVLQTDDRLYVYSHFGSDNPDNLLDIIRFLVSARMCRYILLDHITMAVSGLAGEDERRALDYMSTRLEMMVKELDFALIFVSHVNDNGFTRGSRYLSKVCDTRIDLKRDVLNPDPVERNSLYLTIPYNRFGGASGPAGKLIFDRDKYMFSEANDNGGEDATTSDSGSRRAA